MSANGGQDLVFGLIKSELDKSVDLSICGLAPAESQMDLFLNTLYSRNQTKGRHFNQSGEATSRRLTEPQGQTGEGRLDLWLSRWGSGPVVGSIPTQVRDFFLSLGAVLNPSSITFTVA